MKNAEHTIQMENDKTGLLFPSLASGNNGDNENAHFLLVVQGSEQGRALELNQQPLTIGRQIDNELCLHDPCVSKQHCEITLDHDLVWVTDLNSTNGTFLNEQRIAGKVAWPEGGLLRVGGHVLKHEYHHKQSMEESATLAADFKKAGAYVQSLLPMPIMAGPVRVDWCFVPSAMLGGDSLGYYWLDSERFVFYLVDVCGHGIGPAMHAVSVLNVLRHRYLSGVDFGEPSEVLGKLNAVLPMEEHADMFFSIWYGVYRISNRLLTFASGGHPPAILLAPDSLAARDLNTPGLFVGVMPAGEYAQQSLKLAPGSTLCVFSDGVYEITQADGNEWSLEELRALLAAQAGSATLSAHSVYRKVLSLARNGKIGDDFSLMILCFP